MEKINIENYTPMPDRILLEEPKVNIKVGATDLDMNKGQKQMDEEKANWIEDGKPLQVAKDFKSSDGTIEIKAGEYVALSGQWGMIRLVFEDADRLQLPITSIAGKITV